MCVSVCVCGGNVPVHECTCVHTRGGPDETSEGFLYGSPEGFSLTLTLSSPPGLWA